MLAVGTYNLYGNHTRKLAAAAPCRPAANARGGWCFRCPIRWSGSEWAQLALTVTAASACQDGKNGPGVRLRGTLPWYIQNLAAACQWLYSQQDTSSRGTPPEIERRDAIHVVW